MNTIMIYRFSEKNWRGYFFVSWGLLSECPT